MFASLKGLWDLIAIFKRLLEWFIAEENKQIGRNEANYDTTRKTAETENAMRDVPRPDDDAVADKLSKGSF
jgi:hypothetical protein